MSESIPLEPAVQSPPPTAQPDRATADEPRQRLLRLAAELIRSHDRRLLVEYLTLRRTVR